MNSINKNIFYVSGIPLDEYKEILHKESINIAEITTINKGIPDTSLLLFFVTQEFFNSNAEQIKRTASDSLFFSTILVIDSGTEPASDNAYIDDIIQKPLSKVVFLKKVKKYFSELHARYQTSVIKKELELRTTEIKELSHIGAMLMQEKDLHKLLCQILLKSRELTSADAGSLYLIEENEDREKYLRFKLSQTDSLDISYQEFTMPVSKSSIAGYVAATCETLNIEDVYEISPEKEYKINKSFDEKFNYRTKSMLVVPLLNHVDEIIGLIQLINKKKSKEKLLKSLEDFITEVIPFDKKSETLLMALSGQAAVAIENNLLYQSIENLFEGFVKASITAIESRDPTTSGHSQRVAKLTVGIAEKLNDFRYGKYADIKFSEEQIKEIRYASLLHDFGKVGVKENVLLKADKLYPSELREIINRIEQIKQKIIIENLNKKVEHLEKNGNKNYDEFLRSADGQLKNQIEELNRYENAIRASNEPSILAEDNLELLQKILDKSYTFSDNTTINLLTPEEFKDLSIRKGSLNHLQRLEIESHVTHTFQFLREVPWTKELKSIPDIAYAHHEKLTGEGYPRKIAEKRIPLQSKMMAVSDIFDALTASDRPYKKAVPYERALDILKMDVKSNHIDADLVDLFINAEIYKRVINII